MNGQKTSNRGSGGAVRAAAGLMLSLWLITFALAAVPQIHRLLHQDADHATHHCLITQVGQYSPLAGFVPLTVPLAPIASYQLSSSGDLRALSIFDYPYSPSRAPPSVIPTSVVVG